MPFAHDRICAGRAATWFNRDPMTYLHLTLPSSFARPIAAFPGARIPAHALPARGK